MIEKILKEIALRAIETEYQAFNVTNDEMSDGSINSIIENSTVSAMLYTGDLQQSLPINHYPYWVIKWNKKKAPFMKQILEHNTEEGHIQCHALNERVEDFKIPICEIEQLYYVTHVTIPVHKV